MSLFWGPGFCEWSALHTQTWFVCVARPICNRNPRVLENENQFIMIIIIEQNELSLLKTSQELAGRRLGPLGHARALHPSIPVLIGLPLPTNKPSVLQWIVRTTRILLHQRILGAIKRKKSGSRKLALDFWTPMIVMSFMRETDNRQEPCLFVCFHPSWIAWNLCKPFLIGHQMAVKRALNPAWLGGTSVDMPAVGRDSWLVTGSTTWCLYSSISILWLYACLSKIPLISYKPANPFIKKLLTFWQIIRRLSTTRRVWANDEDEEPLYFWQISSNDSTIEMPKTKTWWICWKKQISLMSLMYLSLTKPHGPVSYSFGKVTAEDSSVPLHTIRRNLCASINFSPTGNYSQASNFVLHFLVNFTAEIISSRDCHCRPNLIQTLQTFRCLSMQNAFKSSFKNMEVMDKLENKVTNHDLNNPLKALYPWKTQQPCRVQSWKNWSIYSVLIKETRKALEIE